MCTPCWWTKSCNSWPSHKTTVISRKYIIYMYIHNLSYSTKAIPYQLMQDCVHQQYGPIRIHIISPGGNRSIPFLSPNYTGQEPPEVEEAAQTSKSIEALEHIEDKAWLDKQLWLIQVPYPDIYWCMKKYIYFGELQTEDTWWNSHSFEDPILIFCGDRGLFHGFRKFGGFLSKPLMFQLKVVRFRSTLPTTNATNRAFFTS